MHEGMEGLYRNFGETVNDFEQNGEPPVSPSLEQ